MASVFQGFALLVAASALVYVCIQAVGRTKNDDDSHSSHGSHGHH